MEITGILLVMVMSGHTNEMFALKTKLDSLSSMKDTAAHSEMHFFFENLEKKVDSMLLSSVYSILFYSILFYSILFYSILFYSVLFFGQRGT